MSGSAILISACLLGLPTRYDGRRSANNELIERLAAFSPVPCCPEQLGGLATPRPPCHFEGGDGFDVLDGRARVIDLDGGDRTVAYVAGAEACLAIAELTGARAALLRAHSPSCGPVAGTGSDGSPRPVGVAAAALIRAGLTVYEIGESGLSDEAAAFLAIPDPI